MLGECGPDSSPTPKPPKPSGCPPQPTASDGALLPVPRSNLSCCPLLPAVPTAQADAHAAVDVAPLDHRLDVGLDALSKRLTAAETLRARRYRAGPSVDDTSLTLCSFKTLGLFAMSVLDIDTDRVRADQLREFVEEQKQAAAEKQVGAVDKELQDLAAEKRGEIRAYEELLYYLESRTGKSAQLSSQSWRAEE